MNIWLERSIIVCLALFACFIFLELGVRIIISIQQENVLCAYQPDQTRGWKLQPNLDIQTIAPSLEYSHSIKTNFRGERSPEIEVNKEDYLILGIGDSMTFGQGVKETETYLRILEKQLGNKTTVLNTGVGGYNTIQAVDTLEIYLKNFDINLVVLGFFAGNDIYGNQQDVFAYEVIEGCLKTKPTKGTGTKHFLRTNFKSYGFFAEKLRTIPIASDILITIGLMSEKRPAPYMLSMEVNGLQSSWNTTEKQFQRMQKIAQNNNIQIIIVAIPSNFQVNDNLAKQALNAYGISQNGFKYNYPEQKLAKFVEDKPNLVLVTLLEEFRQSNQKLFYQTDPHLTKEGHNLTAQIITKELNRG